MSRIAILNDRLDACHISYQGKRRNPADMSSLSLIPRRPGFRDSEVWQKELFTLSSQLWLLFRK